jgi:hypothetical protein
MGLEYAVFAVPPGSDAEIVSAEADGDAITSESWIVLVCAGLPESVTVTAKLVVPLAVGVPEIKPEFGEMARPAGRGAEAGEIDQV